MSNQITIGERPYKNWHEKYIFEGFDVEMSLFTWWFYSEQNIVATNKKKILHGINMFLQLTFQKSSQ